MNASADKAHKPPRTRLLEIGKDVMLMIKAPRHQADGAKPADAGVRTSRLLRRKVIWASANQLDSATFWSLMSCGRSRPWRRRAAALH